jgi:hypothetical protein
MRARTRQLGGTGWNILRGFVGIAYIVAAGFNLLVTMPSGDLTWFADSAWFGSLDRFVTDTVIPNREIFIALLAAFEVAVGVSILSRGRLVDIGVGAAVLWVLFLLPFLPFVPMGVTNVALGLVQGAISLRRYESPMWLRSASTRSGAET